VIGRNRTMTNFNPSLERASLKIFCKRPPNRPHLGRFWQNELDYAIGASRSRNAGDLACCDLLLLIEKSPLTEKRLKQQIIVQNQFRPISSEVLKSLVCSHNAGITTANPNSD
jgi:hypothetical protein